ncbi:MAG: hypothetical protein COB81_04875, partial [Flavobacteriaceae bacterium]
GYGAVFSNLELDVYNLGLDYLDAINDFNKVTETSTSSGFYIGGFVSVAISNKFQIQGNVNYSRISKGGFNANYVTIPIVLSYAVLKSLKVQLGPWLNMQLDDTTSDYKSTVVDIATGLRYDINSKLLLEARYGFSVTNRYGKMNGTDLKNSPFQIGLGYKFN